MNATEEVEVLAVADGRQERRQDALAVEEPLEIRIGGHSIAVTMRTPGHDVELAAGFLFTEGVIARREGVAAIQHVPGSNSNVIRADLAAGVKFDPGKLSRHVFTSSSCGVCAKTTLEQVRAVMPAPVRKPAAPISPDVLVSLPGKLRNEQAVFDSTGGLHATALFDVSGALLLTREDVGRHNAMDKVIGALLLSNKLPANETIALVSGRASFELVQKAAMAGIPRLAAVGAPSSLAVELARQCEMTLIGFLRNGRFNVYSGGPVAW